MNSPLGGNAMLVLAPTRFWAGARVNDWRGRDDDSVELESGIDVRGKLFLGAVMLALVARVYIGMMGAAGIDAKSVGIGPLQCRALKRLDIGA